jgi:hypothetical protein
MPAFLSAPPSVLIRSQASQSASNASRLNFDIWIKKLAAGLLQKLVESAVAGSERGARQGVAQNRRGKTNDFAVFAQVVNKAVATENSIDGLAKLVPPGLDIET